MNYKKLMMKFQKNQLHLKRRLKRKKHLLSEEEGKQNNINTRNNEQMRRKISGLLETESKDTQKDNFAMVDFLKSNYCTFSSTQ